VRWSRLLNAAPEAGYWAGRAPVLPEAHRWWPDQRRDSPSLPIQSTAFRQPAAVVATRVTGAAGMAGGRAGTRPPVITTVLQRCPRTNGGDHEPRPRRNPAPVFRLASGALHPAWRSPAGWMS